MQVHIKFNIYIIHRYIAYTYVPIWKVGVGVASIVSDSSVVVNVLHNHNIRIYIISCINHTINHTYMVCVTVCNSCKDELDV